MTGERKEMSPWPKKGEELIVPVYVTKGWAAHPTFTAAIVTVTNPGWETQKPFSAWEVTHLQSGLRSPHQGDQWSQERLADALAGHFPDWTHGEDGAGELHILDSKHSTEIFEFMQRWEAPEEPPSADLLQRLITSLNHALEEVHDAYAEAEVAAATAREKREYASVCSERVAACSAALLKKHVKEEEK